MIRALKSYLQGSVWVKRPLVTAPITIGGGRTRKAINSNQTYIYINIYTYTHIYIYIIVDLKVLIHSVDYDDPGTRQNLIWLKFFLEFANIFFFAKDMAKDVLSAAVASTTTTAAAATTTPADCCCCCYYYLPPNSTPHKAKVWRKFSSRLAKVHPATSDPQPIMSKSE